MANTKKGKECKLTMTADQLRHQVACFESEAAAVEKQIALAKAQVTELSRRKAYLAKRLWTMRHSYIASAEL